VTLWALLLQARTAAAAISASGAHLDAVTLNGLMSLLLIALAVVLIVEGVRAAQPGRHAETNAA
jgi:carbon starvation protein